MPEPKRAVAFTLTVGLVDTALRPFFKANPTLATGDVKVSKDNGALANIATLPTVAPAAGRLVQVVLSATEMTADRIDVQFVDAAGSEWDEVLVTLLTTVVTVDDLVRSTTPANTLDVSATGEAGLDWANVGSPTTTLNLSGTNIDVDQVVASVSGAVGSVTGAVGSVATGGIAAASFAAGAIDAAAIATDAIGANELAAGAITEIQAGLSTLDAAGVRAAVGLVSPTLDSQFGAVNFFLTNNVTDALTVLQADTDDLQTRIPAALVSGRIDASVGALNGSATAAQNLERSASSIYRGSITATSTSTSLIDSGLTQSGTDHWKGRVVIFTSGTLAGQATDILAFTPGTDALTVTALTAAPSTSDEFVIV